MPPASFLTAACIAALAWLAMLPAQAAPAKREIIVLALFDATRADHVSAYGYKRPTTPTIDALAQQGRRFTQAYCNAPWTRPSVTSFLTGLNASRHGTQTDDTKLNATVTPLAERLQKAGWQTLAFVANGHTGSLALLQRGFDLMEDPTRTYVKGARGVTYLNTLPTGDFIVERAMAAVRQSHAQRIFVFLFFTDAHDPYEAPALLEKSFLGTFDGVVRRRAAWEYNNDYPKNERFSMQAVYDAGILAADRSLGRFRKALQGLSPHRDITWIVSSDHGEGFGEHQFYLHGHQFWDEILRIPLVMQGPRVTQGVDDRLTQSLDVTATVLDLAGVKEVSLPGRSLLLAPRPNAQVISEYNAYGIHRQAIVQGGYKVVWQRPADKAEFMRTVGDPKLLPSVRFDHEVLEAFDRRRDPGEKQPLTSPWPNEAQDLLRQLRAFVLAAGNQSR